MAHELTHAFDCTQHFDKDDMLDDMIKEARGYGMTFGLVKGDCSCDEACDGAWSSTGPASLRKKVLKDVEDWAKAGGKAPRPKAISPAEWDAKYKDKYIKACKDLCQGGPHSNWHNPIKECEKELQKP